MCLGRASYFARFDARGANIQTLGGLAHKGTNALDIRIPAAVGFAL